MRPTTIAIITVKMLVFTVLTRSDHADGKNIEIRGPSGFYSLNPLAAISEIDCTPLGKQDVHGCLLAECLL